MGVIETKRSLALQKTVGEGLYRACEETKARQEVEGEAEAMRKREVAISLSLLNILWDGWVENLKKSA